MVRDRYTLELLVGQLVHATKFIPLGKTFLNTLFTTKARMGSGQICHITVTWRPGQSWHGWIGSYNWTATSVHQLLLLKHPDHHLYIDASGTWGCSAWSTLVQFWLSSETLLPTIAFKKLFSIFVASGLPGQVAPVSAMVTMQLRSPKSKSCTAVTQWTATCSSAWTSCRPSYDC